MVCEVPEITGLSLAHRISLVRIYGIYNNKIVFYITPDKVVGKQSTIDTALNALNLFLTAKTVTCRAKLEAWLAELLEEY